MESVLSVKNLSVGYKNEVIKNISFDVNKCEIVGVIGLNGSGKSTLLGGLCGINKLFGGDIFVGGVKINSLSSKKRARYISYYTQRTPNVSGLLVKQIIQMGSYSKDYFGFSLPNLEGKNNTVNTLAKLFKIEHLLDTDVSKLSEGQRSLAFLAKIFAQDTPIVLLDEPDNNLDYLNTHNLFKVFKAQIEEKNKSALVVLHNPTLALNYCSRLIIIKSGVIVDEVSTAKCSISAIQNALRKIYPDIIINKDTATDAFYTVFNAKKA